MMMMMMMFTSLVLAFGTWTYGKQLDLPDMAVMGIGIRIEYGNPDTGRFQRLSRTLKPPGDVVVWAYQVGSCVSSTADFIPEGDHTHGFQVELAQAHVVHSYEILMVYFVCTQKTTPYIGSCDSRLGMRIFHPSMLSCPWSIAEFWMHWSWQSFGLGHMHYSIFQVRGILSLKELISQHRGPLKVEQLLA